MDRRAFLTTTGVLSAAAAAGVKALEPGTAEFRAAGLANAAAANTRLGAKAAKAAAQAQPGLSVGYLPGSSGLLEYAAVGRSWDPYWVRQMRWTTWAPSVSLPINDPRVDIRLGTLRSAQVWAAPDMVRSVDVVAHFAIDSAPHFTPFDAWRYDGAVAGKRARATSPLTFTADVPDRVGLQVDYAFTPEHVAPGLASSGMVYLPVGARDGPGIGIYVLASPSRITGAVPDFAEYTFTGNLLSPMLRDTGGTPDFDYVLLTIAPAA